MGSYIIEVVLMNRATWTSRGFHRRGHGTHGDPFFIDGRDTALKMGLENARRRVEMYRSRGHKARILDTNDRVVLDWNEPLIPPQRFTRENLHRHWVYRGLRFIENRATELFYHRFAWPIEDGPERSISGLNCEEIVERMQGMGGDIPAYLAAKLDRVEPPDPAPAEPVAQPTVNVSIPEGYEIVGFRPGNTH